MNRFTCEERRVSIIECADACIYSMEAELAALERQDFVDAAEWAEHAELCSETAFKMGEGL